MTMLFGRDPNPEAALAAVAIAALLAWACAVIGSRLVRRLLYRAAGPGFDHKATAGAPVRVVRGALFLLLAIVFVPPALEVFGQPLHRGLRLATLAQWTFDEGLHIAVIILLAFLMTRLIRAATARFEGVLASAVGPDAIERAKRARTLSQLVRNTANIFVATVAALEILDKMGVNIAPILAGASVVGVALGFGAQTVVRDVIGGFFLILENQLRVGDVAEINGTGGLVEAVHLRTIVLRDAHGAVHVIPCGSVTALTNFTKDYSYAVIDLRVNYRYDTDTVIDIMTGVANELAKASPLAPAILEPIEVLGVDTLGDTGVTIRARIKTVPKHQWEVGREFRRRLKKACEANGIELSLPPQRLVLIPGAAPAPAAHEPPR